MTTVAQHPMPTKWHERYTKQDQADVKQVLTWINDGPKEGPLRNSRNQTRLATACGASQSTVNEVLRGKYVSSPSKHLKAMLEYIARDAEREQGPAQHVVETSVYRIAKTVCQRAHLNRDFGILSAVVGVGKTTAVEHYAKQSANVVLVYGTPDMNPMVLLRELVDKTNAVVEKPHQWSRGTKADMMRAVIKRLEGTDTLLILDEAETVQASTLEYVRRISDNAKIGVVLSGTERLRPMVESPIGRHGQISSRVGFWPPVIRGISRKDCDLLVEAALGYLPEPPVADMFWELIEAKARVLNKLLRNVQELVTKGGQDLTAELVLKTGQQLMGLKAPVKQGAK